MNKKSILIIVSVLLLLLVCYFIGENANTAYTINDTFTKEEQEELKNITVDEYLSLKASKDTSVIYIARPTCSHCITQTPRMKYIKYKYKVEVNYLNTDEFSEDNTDYDKVIASDEYFMKNDLATPLILLVKEGKIIDMIEGESSVENVVTLLSDNGLI